MKSSSDGSRAAVLRRLVSFDLDVSTAREMLSHFGWDSANYVVTIGGSDIVSAIARVQSGKVTAATLSDWAEALESREDVGFESDVVQSALFDLANPKLNGVLDPPRLQEIAALAER